MPRIDPRKLETFRAVVHAGTISTAARALHLSQPAISAQIRELERECGRPLLVRSARGVRPNADGLRLLEHAHRLDEVLRAAADAMRGDAEQGGELVLAASQTTAAFVVPPLVAEFRRARGDLAVRVAVGNTAAVLRWLADGAVPLGLVEGLRRAPGVHLERFADDDILPVAASAAPPELLAVRRLSDLDAVPIVWREVGSGTRAVVEQALRRAGYRRRSSRADLSFGTNAAVKAAVLLGLGVGFLSRWAIRSELQAGQLRLLPVHGLHIRRAFSWALPAGGVMGVAGRFLDEARRAAAGPRPAWFP
jgi:DNA-binding transcriptional LysR family regulator